MYEGQHYLYSDQDDPRLCLQFSQGAKLKGAPTIEDKNNNTVTVKEESVSPKGLYCYTLTSSNNKLAKGTYQMGVNYWFNEILKTDWFTLSSNPKPTATKFDCLAAATDKKIAKLKLTGTGFNYLTGLEVDGKYIAVTSKDNKTELTLLAGEKITRLYTPAGDIKVSLDLSACP